MLLIIIILMTHQPLCICRPMILLMISYQPKEKVVVEEDPTMSKFTVIIYLLYHFQPTSVAQPVLACMGRTTYTPQGSLKISTLERFCTNRFSTRHGVGFSSYKSRNYTSRPRGHSGSAVKHLLKMQVVVCLIPRLPAFKGSLIRYYTV